MTLRHLALAAAAILSLTLVSGCVAPNIKLFSDTQDPLKEQVLSGEAREKILVIPVQGFLSDIPENELLREKPSIVQEVVSQLDLARQDPDIRAVVLKINSPGGSATASDILYHEILRFKEDTGVKVVVSMMDVAASGGYYISLAADAIVAHPTTITGSVGVILMRADVSGLLDKIGVSISAQTSGRNKDMGSPFRKATPEEDALFQNVTDTLAAQFLDLVSQKRNIHGEALKTVATARIFTARQAFDLKLIDRIGYVDDALAQARTLAMLPEDATVIAYRRSDYPDDNVYNSTTMKGAARPELVDLGPAAALSRMPAGFYYLWMPGAE